MGEGEAADWVPVENAGAQIADTQWHIKLVCHAISKPARNVGLR